MGDPYRQSLSAPPPFERTPPTLHQPVRATLAGWLVRNLLRPAWSWRVETAIALLLLGIWGLLAGSLGRVWGSLAFASLVLSAPAWPAPVRDRALLVLHRSAVRRDWLQAVRHANLATYSDRVPKPVSIEPIPAGDLMKVRIPAGRRTSELADAGETIAACLAVREIRVNRDRSNARFAEVTIVRCDPLEEYPSLAWPELYATRLSLWEPIPVGVDENGMWVTVSLPERNVLIGGEPGAGKSVAASMLVATAALDPEVDLMLFDGKRVELATWAGCAERIVGPSLEEAIDTLREVQVELDARLLRLLANRRRKFARGDGIRPLVLVVDELAYYCTGPDRRQCAEFSQLLRDIVSRGRAPGIIVIAATQKPSGDTVPTYLRDLFGFRWALRCSTPQASDTILGSGWASMGYSAATIDSAERGVGFLLHEGDRPVRLRTCYLSDDDLDVLRRRAEHLRAADRESSELT
ncbi:MAG TPA: FtsK/SpoIIIE domain-containing protein [Actinomycetes bacterium]|nr:FtsK/SpoIIIE domain-containing protein [Actinomycetes bacterium]